jgi:hypothetical protein
VTETPDSLAGPICIEEFQRAKAEGRIRFDALTEWVAFLMTKEGMRPAPITRDDLRALLRVVENRLVAEGLEQAYVVAHIREVLR